MTKPNKTLEIPKEARLENLAAHYKDSYEIHLTAHGERNRLFYCLLICFALFLISAKETSLSQEIFKLFLTPSEKFCEVIAPFMPVLLWISLMGISVRYFQLCLQVEKQYDYLHALEKELNSYYPESEAFTREGKAYLNDYPMFSNWMWLSYTVFLPATLMLASIYRIGLDINKLGYNYLGLSCLLAYLILEIACFSYLSKIHKTLGEKIEKSWKIALSIQLLAFLILAGIAVKYLV